MDHTNTDEDSEWYQWTLKRIFLLEGFHYIKAFKTFHNIHDQISLSFLNDVDACDKDDHLVVQDFEGDFEVLAQVSILHVWRQCWADQP